MTIDEAAASFGRAVFKQVFPQFCEGDWEIEINDLVTVDAVEAGLVERIPFDPDVHNDSIGSLEAGDEYYTITELGRQVIHG